ncbi:kelch-like protein 41b [Biomphalaria glabrata]|uniref:Kelch-like protein 41b n=1 Tax=Biomphalaria glabrata TaxID=6526 RepID=A0A9W3BAE1_BIOGL|nr:kelch-like protein 41b [Biomphalaria glabrata]
MASHEPIYPTNISQGIVKCLNTFWTRHEDEDFEVNIEGETIRCHSFMLASCSEFFGGLFRSNMKEKLEMKVDLQNIPMKTFQLILQTLYTGCELLTKDNVLEVWSAVHQLQIHFLVQHCEDFVLNNISLDTFEAYKRYASFLQSEKISEGVFNYKLENFMTLRKTEIFLRLDYEELLELIESDGLIVASEDLVLQSVFEWINFGKACISAVKNDNATTLTSSTEVITHSSKMAYSSQGIEINNVSSENVNEVKEVADKSNSNDISQDSLTKTTQTPPVDQKEGAPSAPSQCNDNKRDMYLLPLLKSTRYFLLSEACIANVCRTELIQNSIQDIRFFFETLAYKTCINVYNFLPTAAVHRECSPLESMCVVCCNKEILAYSYVKKKVYFIPKRTKWSTCRLLALNNQLYACVKKKSSSEMFVLQSANWVSVLKLEEQVRFCLTHDSSIIIITLSNSLIYRYKPIFSITKIDIPIGAMDFAISFYQNILVFATSDLKTKVRCWDTTNNTLSHLTELDVEANNMTSFTDDRSTYILDSHGNLYQVNHLQTIQFTFIDRLWSFKAHALKGAVLFRNVLHLCGEFPEETPLTNNGQAIFTLFFLHAPRNSGTLSNFISIAMPKADLLAV